MLIHNLPALWVLLLTDIIITAAFRTSMQILADDLNADYKQDRYAGFCG